MSPNTQLSVSFIIHNDWSHIQPALHSLYATTSIPCDVYVVCNFQNDDALASLKNNFPHVHFILNNKPKGFAANHNQIMRLVKTEYIALLNDDIVLHSGALDTLVLYLNTHPTAGVVGPQLKNPDNTLQVSVYSDPTLLRILYKISGIARLTHQRSPIRHWILKTGIGQRLKVESLNIQPTTRPVPIVKGAVMVARRAAYEQVGLMSEVTQAYGEEMDWHLRMRLYGWQVIFVAEAQVTHYGSGQAELKLRGQMLAEDRKAILFYWHTHRPYWQTIIVRLAIMLSHSCWGIIWLPFDLSRAKTHWRIMKIGLSWMPPKTKEKP